MEKQYSAGGVLINKEDVILKTQVNPSTFIISVNLEFTNFKIKSSVGHCIPTYNKCEHIGYNP